MMLILRNTGQNRSTMPVNMLRRYVQDMIDGIQRPDLSVYSILAIIMTHIERKDDRDTVNTERICRLKSVKRTTLGTTSPDAHVSSMRLGQSALTGKAS